jgi:type III restriction enzyme
LDLTNSTVIQTIQQVKKEIQAQAKNTETVKHSEDLTRHEVQAQMTQMYLRRYRIMFRI